MDDASRIEDLEEALRRIVVVISPDGCHLCCGRDEAVLAIALDQLGLEACYLVPHPCAAKGLPV